MSKHIELNAKSIYWHAQHDWARMHDDGRMEYGLNTFLPPLRNLMQMATQIAKGDLYRVRLAVECHGDDKLYNEVWADQTQWMKGANHNDVFTLKVDCKIDYTGHLAWWIMAREPGDDSLNHSGAYMAPDFAFAWYIASAWEHHNEWMSEQVSVVGGLA